jgi:hypothetical protein
MAVRIRVLVAAASVLLACGTASAGDVYQWKDAKGVTHYADAPPPKGQYQSRDVSNRDGQVATTAADAAPVTDKNCALAKTNLDRLKSGGNIGVDADGDGKPDTLMTDDERTRQRALAETQVNAYCSPAAAPASP